MDAREWNALYNVAYADEYAYAERARTAVLRERLRDLRAAWNADPNNPALTARCNAIADIVPLFAR